MAPRVPVCWWQQAALAPCSGAPEAAVVLALPMRPWLQQFLSSGGSGSPVVVAGALAMAAAMAALVVAAGASAPMVPVLLCGRRQLRVGSLI